MAARKNTQNTQAKAGTAQAAKTATEAEQKAAEDNKAAEEQAAGESQQTTVEQVPATEAEKKAAEEAARNGKPTPVLMIRSTRKGGHRRAGMRWTREPIGVPVADLTQEQKEQLEGDPNIVMEEAEVDL